MNEIDKVRTAIVGITLGIKPRENENLDDYVKRVEKKLAMMAKEERYHEVGNQ